MNKGKLMKKMNCKNGLTFENVYQSHLQWDNGTIDERERKGNLREDKITRLCFVWILLFYFTNK